MKKQQTKKLTKTYLMSRDVKDVGGMEAGYISIILSQTHRLWVTEGRVGTVCTSGGPHACFNLLLYKRSISCKKWHIHIAMYQYSPHGMGSTLVSEPVRSQIWGLVESAKLSDEQLHCVCICTWTLTRLCIFSNPWYKTRSKAGIYSS